MKAIATIQSDTVNGTVIFYPTTPVTVQFDLTGKKNSVHAIHIHEYGDLTNGCQSLGGHWNPHNTTHGSMLYENKPRHAGDLINNLFFNDQGQFKYKYQDAMIQNIDEILGRSIVIHSGIDDLGQGGNEESLKTGNAGGRIACAVIGLSV